MNLVHVLLRLADSLDKFGEGIERKFDELSGAVDLMGEQVVRATSRLRVDVQSLGRSVDVLTEQVRRQEKTLEQVNVYAQKLAAEKVPDERPTLPPLLRIVEDANDHL